MTGRVKIKPILRSRKMIRNSPSARIRLASISTRKITTNVAALKKEKFTSNETSSSSSEETFDYDDLCSNITHIAYFRDDPFICNKYIRCNHGYAQKFKCYRDTAWDIARKTCLWVNNVECGERQLVDPSLLGENDPDESMKHNGTRKTRTTRTTTTTTTTTTIKTTTGLCSQHDYFMQTTHYSTFYRIGQYLVLQLSYESFFFKTNIKVFFVLFDSTFSEIL